MTLVACSDCGTEISDSAVACFKCGRRGAIGKFDRRSRWEPGAIVASLVGLLALVVSAYTAWIQREQVRAQVWPNLVVGYDDNEHLLAVMNKGVGPAQIRSVQIKVDGEPQKDWRGVFDALGAHGVVTQHSSLSNNVLTPNERLIFMSVETATDYDHFRHEAATRFDLEICYCSTLNECWIHRGQNVTTSSLRESASCSESATSELFQD